MKRLIRSKKGFNTILTILALVFILFVLALFVLLFRGKKETPKPLESQFSSIDTEYTLRNFLQAPSGVSPGSSAFRFNSDLSNADIISLTCKKTDSSEFKSLEKNINYFFSMLYGKNWHFELIYYLATKDLTADKITAADIQFKSFGDASIHSIMSGNTDLNDFLSTTDDSVNSQRLALFKLNIRGENIGTQYLPCQEDDKIVKVILLQSAAEEGPRETQSENTATQEQPANPQTPQTVPQTNPQPTPQPISPPPNPSKSIIIGDSQTPYIDLQTGKVDRLSTTQGESSLWKVGMGVSWLADAVEKYPLDNSVIHVVINIGTNGGFDTAIKDDVPHLINALHHTFPNAKLYVVEGSWNWKGGDVNTGLGNARVKQADVDAYYKRFSDLGVTIILPAIGDLQAKYDPHGNLPIYKDIGTAIDSAIN